MQPILSVSACLDGSLRISEHLLASLRSFKRLLQSLSLRGLENVLNSFFYLKWKSHAPAIALLMLSETFFHLLEAITALALASIGCRDICGELIAIPLSPSPPPTPSAICEGNGLAYCTLPKWPDMIWPQSQINVWRMGMDRTVSDSLPIRSWWL